MTQRQKPKKRQPTKAPAAPSTQAFTPFPAAPETWEVALIRAGARVFIALFGVVEKGLDYRVVLTVTGGAVALVALLKPDDRLGAVRALLDALDKFGQQAASGWLQWLGWFLFVTLAAVTVPFAVMSTRRIKQLGDDQKRRRDELDPNRISSLDTNGLRARFAGGAQTEGRSTRVASADDDETADPLATGGRRGSQ